MRVDEFDKIVEQWKSYLLIDALEGYELEIENDVPRDFAAIALYLDCQTVKAAGEVLEYYDGYRQSAADILSFIGVELVQDDQMRVITIRRSFFKVDREEKLKEYIWG